MHDPDAREAFRIPGKAAGKEQDRSMSLCLRWGGNNRKIRERKRCKRPEAETWNSRGNPEGDIINNIYIYIS